MALDDIEYTFTTVEVARLFRVRTKTVVGWAVRERIKYTRTPTGFYRFAESEVFKQLYIMGGNTALEIDRMIEGVRNAGRVR